MVTAHLPIYTSWPKISPGLATKTQLSRERLMLPEDAQPVAYKKSVMPVRFYPLYRRKDAVAMPPKREQKARDYTSIFIKRYTSPRHAYVAACESLFQLNRYAKWERCSEQHREAIYDLKGAWIKLLYTEGFCTEAIPLLAPEKRLDCRRCSGTGIDDWEMYCTRCDGTGYHLVESKPFWAFRFVVDGQSFAWHQPAPLSFPAQPIGTQEQHEVVVEIKPVTLSPHKFAEAKALIAWCLAENAETCVSTD